jgi:hypothetical protein
MALLGFDAIGQFALGQIGPLPPTLPFSRWDSSNRNRNTALQVTQSFVAVPVVLPTSVFTSFSQPSAKKQVTHNQGFVTQPVAQVVAVTPVFTGFSQPQPIKAKSNTDVNFRILRPDAATPGPLVFTRFSEPSFTKVRPQTDLTTQLQPIVVATTVVAGGDFSDFDLVQTKKNLQQGFTGFVSVPPVLTTVFSSFSQPQVAKIVKEGNVSTSLTTVVQSTVFGRFDQPLTKRVLQQDYSFVNLPVVQVVTQPFVFSDFGMPKKAGLIQPDFLVTPAFLTPVVTTVNFSGFSDFGVPKKSGIIQQDFLNSPILPVVQNYVFTQFSQPQIVKVYREGFTNAPFVASDIKYIFSPFAQPQSKQVLQVDQSFVNLPVIVQVVQPYVFTTFEQPQFKRSPQLDASVQFEVLQPAFVPSVVVFTGFSDFGYVLHPSYLAALQSGISYDIIVPAPEEPFVFAGRWHKLEGGLKPNVIKLDSSNLAEVVHNRNSNELIVKFQNDKVYHYSNVDENKVKSLVNAKSSGGYLHDQIKGKYFTTRIK